MRPIESQAANTNVIGFGYFPPTENRKPWGERLQPWVTIIGIFVAVCAYFLNLSKEGREREGSARSRFTVPFEAARKIADSVFIKPSTCGPLGWAGVQRHPADDRERRQLTTHAMICLNVVTASPQAAFPNELLEVSEYLYTCGSFAAARRAIELTQKESSRTTVSEKAAASSILALIEAADNNFKAAKDNIKKGQEVVSSAKELAEGEKGILDMRLLIALAEIEASENPVRGPTGETRAKIDGLAARLPNSVPADAVKELARIFFLGPETAPVESEPAPLHDERNSASHVSDTALHGAIDELSEPAARELLQILLKAMQQPANVSNPVSPEMRTEVTPASGVHENSNAVPIDQNRRIEVDEIVVKNVTIVSADGKTEIGRISSDRVSSYLHHEPGAARPGSTLLFEIGRNSRDGGSLIIRHPSEEENERSTPPKKGKPTGVEVRAWRHQTDVMIVDEEGQPVPDSLRWIKK